MEKFKAVEKEMKTKAFSKEGLSAAAKLDPKEQEKLDGCTFLSDMVEELERQVETLEAEEEALQATVRKGKKDTGKADRLAEISRLTERHKWHQAKLELLLRALENGNVDIEQVNDIKEGIKYYAEENQSVEFLEDDSIYDEFNLDQDEAAWGIANEADRVSSQDAQSVQDESIEPGETRSVSASNVKQKSAATDPPIVAARRPSNQLKSPLPALATLHTPLPSSTTGASSSSMKPAPLPTRAPGETLKYASAAAAAAATDKGMGIAPLPPPPGSSTTLAPLPPPPSKGSTTTSPSTMPSVPATFQTTSSQKATMPPPAPASVATSAQAPQSPTVSHAASGSSIPPTPALEKSEAILPSRSKQPQPLLLHEVVHQATPEPEEPGTPPQTVDESGPSHQHGEPTIEQEESIYHLPPGLQDLIQSFEVTKSRAATTNPKQLQRSLAISHKNAPKPSDGEPPRHYKPPNKYVTPDFYPQEPADFTDDPNLYSRLDNDTLFYIFYYRQGTYQQYLAAKALKSQSWRFHKQYQTWFQRHEEPKSITEEYEQGTYRFFDYESTWYVFYPAPIFLLIPLLPYLPPTDSSKKPKKENTH